MPIRRLFFWAHLTAGVLAGFVIVIMSVTGALLTYERQMLEWADSSFRSTPSGDTAPLAMETLLARVRAAQPELNIIGATVRADPEAPVTVAAGQRTLHVDRYSGALLGESSRTGVRQAMSTLREWHRWLAMSGDSRTMAKAITGWSNVIFAFIVLSGLYIWLPRQWTPRHFRAVMLFGRGLSGKARDFNWHNVIGFWSAVPLFIVVISAAPISFPWASALIYRAVGEEPPRQGGGPGGPERPRPGGAPEGAATPASFERLDTLLATAEGKVPGWRSIQLRLPQGGSSSVTFTIDQGNGGQPHLRSTLVLEQKTSRIESWEPFAAQSRGRRLRSIARFAHTGEVLGIPGQTVAGLVSAGGAVLVWTGLALAWRRFLGWRRRSRDLGMTASVSERSTAA